MPNYDHIGCDILLRAQCKREWMWGKVLTEEGAALVFALVVCTFALYKLLFGCVSSPRIPGHGRAAASRRAVLPSRAEPGPQTTDVSPAGRAHDEPAASHEATAID